MVARANWVLRWSELEKTMIFNSYFLENSENFLGFIKFSKKTFFKLLKILKKMSKTFKDFFMKKIDKYHKIPHPLNFCQGGYFM